MWLCSPFIPATPRQPEASGRSGRASASRRWSPFAALSLFLAAIAFAWIAVAPAPLLAQSSVRPPGNAVIFPDAPEPDAPNTLGNESVSDFWRAFRGGRPRVPDEVLALKRPPRAQMNITGEIWRTLRERVLRPYGGWPPVAVIAILALVYLVRGPMRIKGGRSGRRIPRFRINQRVAHWFMAVVFLFLGLSGLTILLGRVVIEPLLGKPATSVLISAALQGHNLFGPIFIVALLWLSAVFMRGNFFQRVDFRWMLKLGGFFGGHVSADKFNFGEKAWFWLVVLVGLVMSVTGVLMLFPWLLDDLRWLQLSNVLHALGAIVLLSVAIGHIYMGTIGMEGALEGMVTGEVDENWAREHHDLWYEKVTGRKAEAGETGAVAKEGEKGKEAGK